VGDIGVASAVGDEIGVEMTEVGDGAPAGDDRTPFSGPENHRASAIRATPATKSTGRTHHHRVDAFTLYSSSTPAAAYRLLRTRS
jgi:hypothetical protein